MQRNVPPILVYRGAFPMEKKIIEIIYIKKDKLSEILNKPETKKIRNILNNLKGKCKECLYTDCYGCRGSAFNLKGDIFNSDPVCWM